MKKGFTLIEVTIVIAIFGVLAGLVIANLDKGQHGQALKTASLTMLDDIRSVQNMTLVGTTTSVCHVYEENGTPADQSDDIFIEYAEDCSPASLCAPQGIGKYAQCETIVPPGGFGVHFSAGVTDRYLLFADFSDETRDLAIGKPAYYEGPGNTDSLIKTVVLPEDVEIYGTQIVGQFTQPAGIGGTAACMPVAGQQFSFIPPNEDISFAWLQPEGKLYGELQAFVPSQSGVCPDFIYRILLRHTEIDTCRLITVNGASDLVDEESNSSCTFPPI